MNEIPEATISRYLSSEESLLWAGRPPQGLLLRPSDALYFPFTLLWAGFAVFWEYSVITSNAPFFFRLWGIPFVLVGLYIVVGRFFVDAHARSRTTYGLTSQRVLIVSESIRREIKSLPLRTLSDVSLSERSNGSGTISFGGEAPWWSAFAMWPGSKKGQAPCFESIPEARRVFDQLRAAQART
jgi:hypothetical protein